jgi:enamine deaminase RidA (YjgF/YER057c/UK114 family)
MSEEDKLKIEGRIQDLGLELPEISRPVGNYVSAVKTGNYVFTTGHVPFVKGVLKAKGKVGGDLTLEEGYKCARIAALNCLAAVRSLIGDLDQVLQIVRVTGFVNSAPGFEEQAKVLNGASDLLVEIFGERGKHARLAVGTNELPLGAPVEVEMIVEVR